MAASRFCIFDPLPCWAMTMYLLRPGNSSARIQNDQAVQFLREWIQTDCSTVALHVEDMASGPLVQRRLAVIVT